MGPLNRMKYLTVTLTHFPSPFKLRCFKTGMGQGLPDSVQPSIRKPFTIRSACWGPTCHEDDWGRGEDVRLHTGMIVSLCSFHASSKPRQKENGCFVCSRIQDPDKGLDDLSVQVQVNYFSPGCIILPSAWVKVKHCSPQYLIVDMTFALTCARGACETYHQVMKEKLPGLTQLLVEQHVKKVVDEVTCGEKKTFRKHLAFQFRFPFDQPKRDRFLWQWELWVHQVCRVDPASMATANQDVSRRGSIHICRPRPFPPTDRTHGDSYSESWKNNEVLRMGTKGCRGAQGFGGMGINRIMEGNLTPGSVFPLLCDVSHQT